MSSKTAVRTVDVRIKDSSASGLMAIARMMTSLAREINMVRMAYEALADSELMAEAAGGDFVAMATLAIRALGVLGGAARVGAAGALLGGGGAGIVPVGQTRGGEVRQLAGSGPVWAHAGESLGRLGPPEKAGGGGGGFNMNIEHVTLAKDGDDPEAFGRFYTHVRAGVLSSDIPAS